MRLSEALENVGKEVTYIHPGTRVALSRGVILGANIANRSMVNVRYPEGDHPTCPVNLKLRSQP